MNKSAMWLGAGIGGVVGSFIPALWGAGQLSAWSFLFGTIGGVLGIVAVYKLYSSS
jgi:hypothetical protein